MTRKLGIYFHFSSGNPLILMVTNSKSACVEKAFEDWGETADLRVSVSFSHYHENLARCQGRSFPGMSYY